MSSPSPWRSLVEDTAGRVGWLLIALAVVVAAVVGVYRAVYGVSDFRGFYEGARIVWTEHRLSTDDLVTRYPFTFQVLLAPLGALPVALAAVIWNLLNVAAICHLPRLFEQLSGVAMRRQLIGWLLMLPLTWDNLILGQSAPLLLWMATAALVWAMRGRSVRGGLLLGLAVCIKVIPAVFFFVPWSRRRIVGTTAGALLAVAASTLLGACFVGFGPLWPNTTEWWRYSTQGHSLRTMFGFGGILAYNNQSLTSVLVRTFGDIAVPAKGVVRIASLSKESVQVLFVLLLAPAVLAGLAAAWRVRRSDRGKDWLGLFALIAIGMLLVSPIVWTHYFLWVTPAVIYLVDRRRLLIASMAISWIGLAVIPARALGIHLLWAMGLYYFVAWDMIRQPEPAAQGSPAVLPPAPPAPAAP